MLILCLCVDDGWCRVCAMVGSRCGCGSLMMFFSCLIC